MAISNYTSIKQDAKAFAEALKEKVNRNNSEASPFQEGSKFKLSDDPIDLVRNEEGKIYTVVLLKDEQGTEVQMWLSMLTKEDVDNHQLVKSEAAINTAFRAATVGKDLTNEEYAKAFINIVGSKTIKVVRTHYVRTRPSRRGGTFSFPASLVGFEFVD